MKTIKVYFRHVLILLLVLFSGALLAQTEHGMELVDLEDVDRYYGEYDSPFLWGGADEQHQMLGMAEQSIGLSFADDYIDQLWLSVFGQRFDPAQSSIVVQGEDLALGLEKSAQLTFMLIDQRAPEKLYRGSFVIHEDEALSYVGVVSRQVV